MPMNENKSESVVTCDISAFDSEILEEGKITKKTQEEAQRRVEMKHKIRKHGLTVASDTTTDKLLKLVDIVKWCEQGGAWCDVHNPNR